MGPLGTQKGFTKLSPLSLFKESEAITSSCTALYFLFSFWLPRAAEKKLSFTMLQVQGWQPRDYWLANK